MNKVLIVEDDKEYAKFVKRILKDDCEIDHIEDKNTLLAACAKGDLRKYSLILFDLFLKNDCGINLCQKVKSILKDQMPLTILISERAERDDRLKAFKSYFFDFIDKDYDDEEIRLRILSALYYSEQFMGQLAADGLRFDLEKQSVVIDGHQPTLTPIEFKILYNGANSPQGMRKEKLIKNVWNDQLVLSQTLNVHIHNLNKKIHTTGRKISISSNGIVTYCRFQ